jgi:hypothetical protein
MGQETVWVHITNVAVSVLLDTSSLDRTFLTYDLIVDGLAMSFLPDIKAPPALFSHRRGFLFVSLIWGSVYQMKGSFCFLDRCYFSAVTLISTARTILREE